MQKKLILSVGVLGFLLLINSSCSKSDKDPAPSNKTKTQLLTTGSWKYQSIDPSLAEAYITCFKDNVTTFTTDGKGGCLDSGVQCTPPTGNFNWNFTDNETKLHLDATLIPSGTNDFTIVTLNETNLVLSQVITAPVTATITVTLKH